MRRYLILNKVSTLVVSNDQILRNNCESSFVENFDWQVFVHKIFQGRSVLHVWCLLIIEMILWFVCFLNDDYFDQLYFHTNQSQNTKFVLTLFCISFTFIPFFPIFSFPTNSQSNFNLVSFVDKHIFHHPSHFPLFTSLFLIFFILPSKINQENF